jgi:hypothetical protein
MAICGIDYGYFNEDTWNEYLILKEQSNNKEKFSEKELALSSFNIDMWNEYLMLKEQSNKNIL